MVVAAVLYVLNYDAESESIARASFRPEAFPHVRIVHVRNPTTPLLESGFFVDHETGIMSRIDQWRDADFVGTISYKGLTKIRFDIDAMISKTVPPETDVVGMYPFRRGLRLIEHGEQMHPGFEALWKKFAEDALGAESREVSNPIPFFANYLFATPKVMEGFCDFMRRAWRTVEARPDLLAPLFTKNAQYPGSIPTPKLLRIFGVPWYPFLPFVFERCMPLYCSMTNLRVHHVFP